MNCKKLLTSFFIIAILFISQSASAERLFEHGEISVYKNEYNDFNNCVTASANVTVENNISGTKEKITSLFKRKIKVLDDKYVYLGGQTVGIAMYTNGIFVTDTVPIEDKNSNFQKPADKAGIKKGDYLLSANGIELNDISNIDAILKASKGEKIKLTFFRDGKTFDTEIQPVKCAKDGAYRLGLWMRDSAAGLGTVTYVDPETRKFAALGHSICDADTGDILLIRSGRLVQCDITGVKKGTNGTAGELKGTFGVNAAQLGEIIDNTRFGIMGTMYDIGERELIPLGSKDMIHEGEAYICSDFENGTLKKYSIEILHVNDQTYPSEKSMVIKITDNKLINKTGGIVQGLSGSPIIQDGKLIGAVTHVMVNDPTKGYGIFIENMIETSKMISEHQYKEAS